ncbi:MAG: cation:proton antiporter [Terrimicrobiaceae bacterium]
MDGLALLRDFAVILLVAAAAGWIFRKCGLSAVVGYLVAGIIIGPYTPPFTLVSDVDRIEALSDLGLAFLMFFVGLGLSLRRIRQLGFAVVGATAVTAFCIYQICQGFAALAGWPEIYGLIFAAMLMTSSSAIITKMLAERGMLHERHAQTAQGITVLEDVVAVVMLTLIGSRLTTTGEASEPVARVIFLLAAFAVVLLVVGLILVPRLLTRYGGSGDADLKAILVCGLVFGAGVAAMSAGFSVALGAFLIGVVVAESPFRARIEKRLAGAQDMFSAIFFVAIGMLIDVRSFWEQWPLILGISTFAIVVRSLAACTGLLAMGTPTTQAASAAVLLIPIGEFAYIVARLGVDAGALPDSFYALAVGVSLVTAGCAPLLAKVAVPFGIAVENHLPLRRALGHYRALLDSLSQRLTSNRVLALTRRRISLAAVEMLLLVGLLGFAHVLEGGIAAFINSAGYDIPFWKPAFHIAFLAVGIVLLGALWRSLSVLAMVYAEALTRQARLMRPTVQFAFQLAAALGLIALVFTLSPALSEFPWATPIGVVAVLALATVLWRQITRLQGAFETSLSASMEATQNHSRSIISETERVQEWNTEVGECLLPDFAACAGKSLGELQLRNQLGCSVIEVDRQGYVVSNPGPSFALYPGDRVLLVGPAEAIGQARTRLEKERPFTDRETDFDATSLESFTIPDSFPAGGRSLEDLKIFGRTGVQVVGIHRNQKRILNPAGNEVLQPLDEILVVGSPAEVRSLKELLGS